MIILIFLGLIGLFVFLVKYVVPVESRKVEEPKPFDIDFESSEKEPSIVVFDVETTGFPMDYDAKASDVDNWPRITQFAWLVLDEDFNLINEESHYIKIPADVDIQKGAERVTGITKDFLNEHGKEIEPILEKFYNHVREVDNVVAHNLSFDKKVVESEYFRIKKKRPFTGKFGICTMKRGTSFCELPKPYGNGYKWPKLEELAEECYGGHYTPILLEKGHNALYDAKVTAKCLVHLVILDYISLK
jgi:DNA polymerase III epsilon subunit-like protein